MKNVRPASLVGVLALGASALLIAGCGGSGRSAASTPLPTDEPTATEFPTWTPAPPLPEISSVTLVPVGTPMAQGGSVDGLYLAEASTGQSFKVETAPGPALWPDAWISPTELVVSPWVQSDNSYYLLNLDAKTLRRLPVMGDQSGVSFSHSSALMTRMGPGSELIISSIADNREVAHIAVAPALTMDSGPRVIWAPDDRHILVRAGNATLQFIASVEATPVVVPAETRDYTGAFFWTPDGRAVVFANAEGIFSINATSGEKTRLYAWPAGTSAGYGDLSISPDGKYVLVSAGDGPKRDLVLVPVNGGTRGARIAYAEMSDAAWSPVDDFVAVIADRCTPDSRLFLVNADGSLRATIPGADFIPRFSADGTTMAYFGSGPEGSAKQDQGGIVIRRATGDNALIAFAPGLFNDGAWSPDGRWMAYSPSGPSPFVDSCAVGDERTAITPFP
jgi:hypothetical protein